MSLRRISVWILLAAMAMCQGHAVELEPPLDRAPPSYRNELEKSLRLAGENRNELEQVLSEIEDELFDEACFLIANMPYRDLGTIECDFLLENIRWADKARANVPWGREIPQDIFLHYVLPYRESQERLQSWRPFFYEELHDLVKDCDTMSEAALLVNRWLDEKIDFKTSERRDQGPVTTVLRGIGRCEEMTIAYVAAARAVCIPARKCWTPWWALNDNNHAWVEVWADEDWYFLGGGEARDSLNDAWFKKPAEHAAAVYSTCFGRWTGEGDNVYKRGERYSLINSTAVYAAPGTLFVQVAGGEREDSVSVWACVFNWGWFRSVAKAETDRTGRARLILGRGDYFLSGGNDSLGFWRKASVIPDTSATIDVTLEANTAPEGFLSLRYFP